MYVSACAEDTILSVHDTKALWEMRTLETWLVKRISWSIGLRHLRRPSNNRRPPAPESDVSYRNVRCTLLFADKTCNQDCYGYPRLQVKWRSQALKTLVKNWTSFFSWRQNPLPSFFLQVTRVNANPTHCCWCLRRTDPTNWCWCLRRTNPNHCCWCLRCTKP